MFSGVEKSKKNCEFIILPRERNPVFQNKSELTSMYTKRSIKSASELKEISICIKINPF